MKIRLYRIISISILIIGCVLSFAAFLEMKRQDSTLFQRKVSEKVDDFLRSLHYRFLANEEVLKGARGLVEASNYVSKTEWESYMISLDLPRGFPSILWTSLVKYVPEKEKEAFLKNYSEQEKASIQIWPKSTNENSFPIIFIHPKGYASLKGYDLGQQKNLKEDLNNLFKIRDVTAGRFIDINPVTVKDSSFLFLLPIYKENQLFGCVASLIDLGEILEIILSESNLTLSNLTLYEGDKEDPNHLVFQKTSIALTSNALTKVVKHVEFAQTKWTFVFSMHNNYIEEITQPHPTYVFVSLIALTLALSVLFFYLPSFSRSLNIQNIATNPFITHLMNNLKQPIVMINPKGEITFWNRSAAELLGYENEDIVGKKEIIAFLDPEDLKKKLSIDPSTAYKNHTSEKFIEALKSDEHQSVWAFVRKDTSLTRHTLRLDEIMSEKEEAIGFIISLSLDSHQNGSNNGLVLMKEPLTTVKTTLETFINHDSLNDEEKARIKDSIDKINALIGHVKNGK